MSSTRTMLFLVVLVNLAVGIQAIDERSMVEKFMAMDEESSGDFEEMLSMAMIEEASNNEELDGDVHLAKRRRIPVSSTFKKDQYVYGQLIVAPNYTVPCPPRDPFITWSGKVSCKAMAATWKEENEQEIYDWCPEPWAQSSCCSYCRGHCKDVGNWMWNCARAHTFFKNHHYPIKVWCAQRGWIKNCCYYCRFHIDDEGEPEFREPQIK